MLPHGNRPPRRTPSCSTASSLLVRRGGPGLRCTPLLKLVHLSSNSSSWRTVDVPHPAVQFAGLASTVANLLEPVQKSEHHRDREQHLERIPLRRPTVWLTVSGAYSGSTSRPRCEHTVGFLEMSVIGRGRLRDAQTRPRRRLSRRSPSGRPSRRDTRPPPDARATGPGRGQWFPPDCFAPPLDEAIPEHVVVAEAERQQPEGTHAPPTATGRPTHRVPVM